jgi:(1->4)-alpha-D-glucan 1-alpha-D-glucosylmutase
LRDPAGYLEELRRALGPDPLIEVEKILEREESLRDWPIDGTSGYEFAVAVTGLFIDPAGAAALAAAHGRATGDSRSFNDRATEAKRMVIASRFPHLVAQIAEELQRGDVTTRRDVLEAAIAELAVQLTVYRTYVTAAVDANDHALLTAAAQHARASLPASEAAVVTEVVTAFTAANRSAAATEGLARWQQLTPPATAKGVEDTAIYEPGQLLAAADVGSDPDRPAVAAAEFHSRMADRQRHWPQAMSTLSTHDSKRSHDARCRLAVLSELPQQWQATIDAIEAVIAPSVGAAGPDAVERRYLYESLVAVWPLSGSVDEAFVTRIRDHMVKAGREAKRRSDWIKPDLDHETAVGAFIESLLQDGEDGARRHLTAMVDEVALAGATNSLASVVVRAAAPGVPDVYQGDDAWLLTLVDPDNRAAVDSAAHAAMLRSLPTAPGEVELSDLLQSWRDGRIKQFVVQRSLRARRDMTEFFATADYAPIEVVGEHRDRLFAFARRTAEHSVVCVVPRLARSIAADFPVGASVWRDTGLVLGPYAEDWVDHISGHEHATDGVVPVGSVLALLPVALLSAKRVAR